PSSRQRTGLPPALWLSRRVDRRGAESRGWPRYSQHNAVQRGGTSMPVRRPLDVAEELIQEFDQCGRATEYLVSVVPFRLWYVSSPTGRGRTIAAMVTHIHGLRKMIAKMGRAPVGPSLDRKTVTPAEARRALRQINETLTTMFRESLGRGDARVKGISR